MESIKELVGKMYVDCLTVNTRVDPGVELGKMLADNFQSVNAAEIKSKQVLIGQIQYFWKLIPDLKWEPQEILQDGNRVIVRCIATGTPKGEFMGLKPDGNKSFRIMTIDIHTVEKDKITTIYHVEEWTTAIMQLKA